MTATLERKSTPTTTIAGRPRKRRLQGWMLTGVSRVPMPARLLLADEWHLVH